MIDKTCGATDCVWYDTDCAFCDVCEYDARRDGMYYDGHEAEVMTDLIFDNSRRGTPQGD